MGLKKKVEDVLKLPEVGAGGRVKSEQQIARERAAATWLFCNRKENSGTPAELRHLAQKVMREFHVHPADVPALMLSVLPSAGREQERAVLDAVRDAADVERRIAAHVEGRRDFYGAADGKERPNLLTTSAFVTGDYRPEWLVEGALVKGQPAILAGASKCLKTNISIDLGVSLATATPFLGEFRVPKSVRVAMISGESGAHTLQETLVRVCVARGINPNDSVNGTLRDGLLWSFTLPCLTDVVAMADFAELLKQFRVEVVVLDPLYLALGDVDARNLFEMGKALRAVGELLQKVGVTPVIVHHANGRLQTGEVMELAHLSYTGLEQYARQFMLLNRRSVYQGDGVHELVMNIGGSAGHGRLAEIRIEEGVVDANFRGRVWTVTVQGAAEAKQVRQDEREQKKASKERDTEKRHDALVLEALDAVVARGQDAATVTEIKTTCGKVNGTNVTKALKRLLEAGLVVEVVFTKRTGKSVEWKGNGFQRTKSYEQATMPGC